jgi:hypothetical protein
MTKLGGRALTFFALCLLLAMGSLAQAQEMSHRFNNQDVIEMTKAGISDDIIISKIRSMNGADSVQFDTSVEGLKALKAANVSDAVIKVIINPAPPPVMAAAPGSAPQIGDPNLPPPEVGVYWKDGQTFVFIGGEALSRAKAGGRAGAFFTDGIKSQHWDAELKGPTSRYRVKDRRPVFYFYVLDGTSSDDFVLLKLNRKGDRREFQIGSFGGMGAGKSGIKQSKELEYDASHVALRTYRVTLKNELKPGEYAFFMGTGQSGMMSAGRVSSSSGGTASGRIYDFTVPE